MGTINNSSEPWFVPIFERHAEELAELLDTSVIAAMAIMTELSKRGILTVDQEDFKLIDEVKRL